MSGRPLFTISLWENDQVEVGVEEVRDVGARILVPTQEVQLVGHLTPSLLGRHILLSVSQNMYFTVIKLC